MKLLYDLGIQLYGLTIQILQGVNPKAKLWIKGRLGWREKLQNLKLQNPIWFHCASLGEFEQGRPIIEQLRKDNPKQQILLTFFSPSGYEVMKNYQGVDTILYLPLDTASNMKDWVRILKPKLMILVKYEFWPNLLKSMEDHKIPVWVVSAIFRENQHFFNAKGKWMLPYLKTIDHFYVQNKSSAQLLETIGIKNTTISGDSRFDRVLEIASENQKIPFVEEFKAQEKLVVIGSSWKEDEDLWVNYIEKDKSNTKYLIAPHNLKPKDIQELYEAFSVPKVRFSEEIKENLSSYKVYILDTIGLLKSVYAYADIAYVGGGYTKSGIHNVLEPAVFGIPVFWGPRYAKFEEAIFLIQAGGGYSIEDQKTFDEYLNTLIHHPEKRKKIGEASEKFVKQMAGATSIIVKDLKQKI